MTPANRNPANDNHARPAAFDARLLSYLPALRKLARLLSTDPEALVNDTVVWALEKHANFRGDVTQPKSGFYNWLQINMRALAQAQRKRRRLETVPVGPRHDAATQPAQEAAVDLAGVRMRLGGRDGAVLALRAAGGSLEEIGADMGISKERVRQLEERARAELKRAVGW